MAVKSERHDRACPDGPAVKRVADGGLLEEGRLAAVARFYGLSERVQLAHVHSGSMSGFPKSRRRHQGRPAPTQASLRPGTAGECRGPYNTICVYLRLLRRLLEAPRA